MVTNSHSGGQRSIRYALFSTPPLVRSIVPRGIDFWCVLIKYYDTTKGAQEQKESLLIYGECEERTIDLVCTVD